MEFSKYAQKFIDELSKKNLNWFDVKDKKFVCLFEKPSQVKALKAVLGSTSETKHIQNISLAGHTMRLKNFEEYDPTLKDKTWFKMVKDKNIPFIPKEYKMVVKEKTTGKFKTDYADMVNSAKRAFNSADYIIMCPDPDNEGCALGLEVIYECNAQDKVIGMINMSKLDFFSLQEEAKYINKIPFWVMAEAGFARSEFDWTFGLNNTILASVLLGGGQTYHIGGVKSPVVRMVVDRMEHIKSFKSVKYWQFHGTAKHTKTNSEFKYIVKVKQSNKEIIETQAKIDSLEIKLNGLNKENPEHIKDITNIYDNLSKFKWTLNELVKEFETNERDIFSKKVKTQIENTIKVGDVLKVSNFEIKKNLTQNPPLAYSLTDLQAEAGNLHNYTPAKTLEIAQKLYEGQWQSYPRTDSRYYASGEMSNIKKIIPNLLGLSSFATVNMPVPYKVKTGVFNSAKVSAHTGLAPTSKEITDKSLVGEMKTLYDMVATRYLIQFMDKFEYYQVKLDVNIDADVYITTFQNIQTQKGWRELYNPSNMYGFNYVEKQSLPNMLIGDEIEVLTIETDNLETKPKPMFSDFTLLKGMENISRIYPELEGLEKGIGTPATRAAILESLFKTKYLIKKDKTIVASDKAVKLMELLPNDMTSPKLRADMESKLSQIIDGTLTRKDYQLEVKSLVELQTTQLYDVAEKHKIVTIDKATLPPSEAQIKFAKTMAKELKLIIPKEVYILKDEMMKWLKKNEKNMPQLLSDKQYDFLKEYGSDDAQIIKILKAHDARTMTKDQKIEAGKKLGMLMRSSIYQKKRAAKAAATRKTNRDVKMQAMGIETPTVQLPKRKPSKKRN